MSMQEITIEGVEELLRFARLRLASKIQELKYIQKDITELFANIAMYERTLERLKKERVCAGMTRE